VRLARARRAFPLAAAAASLLLAGCTPIVTLTPAPEATAVACAAVVVRLPDQIVVRVADQALTESKRETDAQGTAAWGEPVRISLRCGVTTTRPSSQCVTFDEVDWKVQSTSSDGKQQYVLTTYGRSPVVQVVLDAGLPSDQVMPPIADAVAAAIPRASLRCTVQDPGANPSPGSTP
jgi:Protein of unknown function (DUF3515)